jgi:hypothetical protein
VSLTETVHLSPFPMGSVPWCGNRASFPAVRYTIMSVSELQFRLTNSDLSAMMFIVNLCQPRQDLHIRGGGAIRRHPVRLPHAKDTQGSRLSGCKFECLSHRYDFHIWFGAVLPEPPPEKLRLGDVRFDLPGHIEAALKAGPQAAENTALYGNLTAWERFLQWVHQEADMELEDLHFARLKRAW